MNIADAYFNAIAECNTRVEEPDAIQAHIERVVSAMKVWRENVVFNDDPNPSPADSSVAKPIVVDAPKWPTIEQLEGADRRWIGGAQ